MSVRLNIATTTQGFRVSPGDDCCRNATALTFMAWVRNLTYTNVGTNRSHIFDVNNPSFVAYRFGFIQVTGVTGTLFGASRPRPADGYTEFSGTSVLAINTWYHVAAVFDFTAQKIFLYVNGIIDNVPAAYPFWGTPTENVVSNQEAIGSVCDPGASNVIDGKLDDVRVYKRALTANEILTIYNCMGTDGIVNSLRHRFKMIGPYGSNVTGAGVMKDFGSEKFNFTDKFPAFPNSNFWDNSIIKYSRGKV